MSDCRSNMEIEMLIDNSSSQIYDSLKDIADETIKRCTYRKQTVHSGEANLLQPTGDKGYPSFWVRDCNRNICKKLFL
ncbi:MAG: hypothetical protein WC554_16225 [Clostridia bacterium]|jgi:hypothetical protein|nr:hypothetical protein [Clostridia bacterium]